MKYKIIKKKKDCYLLFAKESGKYKVMDIENDCIYIGYDWESAERAFNEYDLEAIRKEKYELFKKWLKENAEA